MNVPPRSLRSLPPEGAQPGLGRPSAWPAVKALDRKVLRDLRLLWSQAITIALVVASGIGGWLGTILAWARWPVA